MLHYLIELNANTWFALSPEKDLVLGHDPAQSTLTLKDDSISAQHARFVFQDGTWFVEDLGSEECTFLKKKALEVGTRYPLVHGDRVSFGFRDFFFSSHAPLLRAEEKEEGDTTPETWGALPAEEQPRWLAQALQPFFVLEQSTEEYVQGILSVFEKIFAPACWIFALEDRVWSHGIEKDDAFAEMILREARFRTAPLSFRTAVHSDESGFRAMYAPLLLQELARGYLCLLAPSEQKPWSEGDFTFFGALSRLMGRGFSTLELLQRAQEDREVLHLNLVGIAPEMKSLKIRLLQTARQEQPALVIGEDGVGKSRIARAIHQASARRQAPLMVLNAANFPKELFELALCGAVADPPHPGRVGKVVLAEGGSLLIEEIGEVPLGVQPTLLGLIRTGEIMPMGAEESVVCHVRLLATSSVPLNELLRQERLIPELAEIFQEQTILVPPLRQRREDIPQLFRAFLARLGEEEGLPTAVVSDEAVSLLKNHRWSLNIRELRSVVGRCFYELDPEHPVVDAELVQRILLEKERADGEQESLMEQEVRSLEIRLIQEALMAANDDVNEAANALGVSLVVLRRKMRRLGIG
ncbi:MAG: sigma 54-interacting transcriptional regulator [Myxococcales bacterium]|nr:sigma 54-interacting transcriptional regulator [Myxococcales bacterium]